MTQYDRRDKANGTVGGYSSRSPSSSNAMKTTKQSMQKTPKYDDPNTREI